MNHMARIRELLSAKPSAPSKDWARKLLDDPHATYLQKRMASEALLPRIGQRERQPGEDDED